MKEFQRYTIINIYPEVADTYIVQVKPKNGATPSFLPGQYVFLKSPSSRDPSETHPFSIASSPHQKDYLEFCIKILGDWTVEFVKLQKGSTVEISAPTGDFVWDNSLTHAVFLLGGIGISPIMSMLRFLKTTEQTPKLTMLYGNRTPDTIAYKKELDQLQKKIDLRVVDIFSHLPENYPWNGYRGFITQDIVEKEVNLDNNPTFFVIGPPIFVEKMNTLLQNLAIPKEQIKQERLEQKTA